MTKTLGFKAWALAASTGLCVGMVSGCNPEEPAKAPAPPPAVKTPAKSTDTHGAAPAPAPKPAEEHH